MQKWLQRTGVLPTFSRDAVENCITLCPTHDRSFRNHHWTLVPTEDDIDKLIHFDTEDYKKRRLGWRSEGETASLPRSVPAVTQLSGWIQFIPIEPLRNDSLGCGYLTYIPRHGGFPAGIRFDFRSQFSPNASWRRRPASDALELNIGEVQMNPWALMLHAIEALGGGFAPLTHRVVRVREKLVTLIDLYNRPLTD